MTSTADIAELLRLYFIQQKVMNLPGIGGFELNRTPARVDHANGYIAPPTYSILYDSLNDIPSREMFAYISRKRNLTEWEAIGAVNNFSAAVKEQLKKGQRFEWSGIGVLENNVSGQLVFEPWEQNFQFLPSQHFNKDSVNNGAYEEHAGMLPDETEETVVEAKASWWIAAAVIAAVSLMLIFVKYVSNDYKFASSRHTRISPSQTPPQVYKPAD